MMGRTEDSTVNYVFHNKSEGRRARWWRKVRQNMQEIELDSIDRLIWRQCVELVRIE